MLSLCLWGLCFCVKVIFVLFCLVIYAEIACLCTCWGQNYFWKGHETCILPKWLLNRMKVSCKIRLKLDLFWFSFFKPYFCIDTSHSAAEVMTKWFPSMHIKSRSLPPSRGQTPDIYGSVHKNVPAVWTIRSRKVGQKYLGKVCVNFRWGNFLFFQGAGNRFSFPKSAALQA